MPGSEQWGSSLADTRKYQYKYVSLQQHAYSGHFYEGGEHLRIWVSSYLPLLDISIGRHQEAGISRCFSTSSSSSSSSRSRSSSGSGIESRGLSDDGNTYSQRLQSPRSNCRSWKMYYYLSVRRKPYTEQKQINREVKMWMVCRNGLL